MIALEWMVIAATTTAALVLGSGRKPGSTRLSDAQRIWIALGCFLIAIGATVQIYGYVSLRGIHSGWPFPRIDGLQKILAWRAPTEASVLGSVALVVAIAILRACFRGMPSKALNGSQRLALSLGGGLIVLSMLFPYMSLYSCSNGVDSRAIQLPSFGSNSNVILALDCDLVSQKKSAFLLGPTREVHWDVMTWRLLSIAFLTAGSLYLARNKMAPIQGSSIHLGPATS